MHVLYMQMYVQVTPVYGNNVKSVYIEASYCKVATRNGRNWSCSSFFLHLSPGSAVMLCRNFKVRCKIHNSNQGKSFGALSKCKYTVYIECFSTISNLCVLLMGAILFTHITAHTMMHTGTFLLSISIHVFVLYIHILFYVL